MKIFKSLEDSGMLIKCIAESIKYETKKQKRGFLGMLLGTSGASLSGNMLGGKSVVRADKGKTTAGQYKFNAAWYFD